MSAPVVLAAPFGLPDPFGLLGGLTDGLLDMGGGILNNAVQDAVRWLVDAALGALVDLATAILEFFWDAAEPDVTAGWFSGGQSTPYGDMVVLAAPLLVVFFLAGIIQGVLRGDSAGMLQMAVLRLPGAVLAMTVVIGITDLLLRATDEMSDAVLGGFRDDVEATTRLLGQVAATPGLGSAGQLLLLVFGGVGLLAAVVLVIELFVRAGLIYIVVALSPLIYAAAVWEQMRGGVRKLAELGLALIVSKFVIAVALSLSAAALVAAWPGEDAPEIATPEMAAGVADGTNVAHTVGLLVGAVVMFGIAAFMPFVLFRLLPMAEAAMVSQGIKAGPVRAAQQAHHTASIARHNPATATRRHAGHRGGGGSGGGHGAAAGSGGSAGAAGSGAAAGAGGAGASGGAAGAGASAGAAGAAAGPAGVAVAAVAAGAKAGLRRTRSSVDRASSAAGPSSSTDGSNGSGPSSGSNGSGSGGAVRQVRWGATGPGTGHEPPSRPAHPGRGSGTSPASRGDDR